MIKNSVLLVIAICLTLTVSANADYDIVWSTLDGGGGTSVGGNYSLTGTIGQADAGEMSGGDYDISGGFWPGSYGCVVNLTDLSNFMYYWLDTGASIPADLDGDGKVDNVDFSDFAYYWLDYCPTGWQLK